MGCCSVFIPYAPDSQSHTSGQAGEIPRVSWMFPNTMALVLGRWKHRILKKLHLTSVPSGTRDLGLLETPPPWIVPCSLQTESHLLFSVSMSPSAQTSSKACIVWLGLGWFMSVKDEEVCPHPDVARGWAVSTCRLGAPMALWGCILGDRCQVGRLVNERMESRQITDGKKPRLQTPHTSAWTLSYKDNGPLGLACKASPRNFGS